MNFLKRLAKKVLLAFLSRWVNGGGKDFWHEVILAEELACSKTLGWTLSLLAQANMIASLIFQLGTKKQIEKTLKPALNGQFYLALAVTEPKSGSDLNSILTKIKITKNGYLLKREKKFITNRSIASYIIVLARTKTQKNPYHLVCFLSLVMSKA